MCVFPLFLSLSVLNNIETYTRIRSHKNQRTKLLVNFPLFKARDEWIQGNLDNKQDVQTVWTARTEYTVSIGTESKQERRRGRESWWIVDWKFIKAINVRYVMSGVYDDVAAIFSALFCFRFLFLRFDFFSSGVLLWNCCALAVCVRVFVLALSIDL